MTDIVDELKALYECEEGSPDFAFVKKAADEIERLREKCDKQAMILRHLTPEKFPGIFFIHSGLGEVDKNGLPEKLLVVPTYGCDWSQVYVKTDKTTGLEW